jgi:hypothetical protein
MAFLDQVHTMPLTQHIMLALLPDVLSRSLILGVLVALRRGLCKLEDWYHKVLPGINEGSAALSRERNPVLDLPAPWPLWMSHGETQLSSRWAASVP